MLWRPTIEQMALPTRAIMRPRRQVDEAIELEPSNRSSLLARCSAYRHLHDYGHAMDDCEEAIRLAPSDAQAHRERGVARLLKADHDGAIPDFTEAIRLDLKSAAAFKGRGDAYEKQGDHDGAAADYRQALTLGPEEKIKNLFEPTHISPPRAAPQP